MNVCRSIWRCPYSPPTLSPRQLTPPKKSSSRWCWPGLVLKFALMSEPGVVVINVRYHVEQ